MSSCVTRIDISISDAHEVSLLENLCECLLTWAQTLECVRLRLNVRYSLYHLLFESLSTLAGVLELQIFSGPAPDVDFNSIADLSRLERLQFAPQIGISENEISNLSRCLETPENFLALRHIMINPKHEQEFGERLENVCFGRCIRLETSKGQCTIPGFIL